jgi:hypothetical protein
VGAAGAGGGGGGKGGKRATDAGGDGGESSKGGKGGGKRRVPEEPEDSLREVKRVRMTSEQEVHAVRACVSSFGLYARTDNKQEFWDLMGEQCAEEMQLGKAPNLKSFMSKRLKMRKEALAKNPAAAPQNEMDEHLDQWIQMEEELEERENEKEKKKKGKEKEKPLSTAEAIRIRENMSLTLRERRSRRDGDAEEGAAEGAAGASGIEEGEWGSVAEEEGSPEEASKAKPERGATFGPSRRTLDRLLRSFEKAQQELVEAFSKASQAYAQNLGELVKNEKEKLAVEKGKVALEGEKIGLLKRALELQGNAGVGGGTGKERKSTMSPSSLGLTSGY